MVDLTTTNILLGIMALVALLEAVALIAAGVMGFRLYRQVTAQIEVLEQRHVMPLAAQATTILQTVQRISDRVEHSTSRVDAAVEGTMQRAEIAVDRVQGGVRKTTGTLVGVVRGVRTAIETFLTDSQEARTMGNGYRAAGAPPPVTPPTAGPASPPAEPF